MLSEPGKAMAPVIVLADAGKGISAAGAASPACSSAAEANQAAVCVPKPWPPWPARQAEGTGRAIAREL